MESLMINCQKRSKNRFSAALLLMLVLIFQFCFVTACAPIKDLEVWKDEAYIQPLNKVLVIVVAQQDNIRNQAENVLSDQLSKRGVEAIPGHKVLPHSDTKPDREVVLSVVKELGGVVLGGSAVYSNGDWYGYSYGYSYNRQYDTDYFTVSTKLYDVNTQNPVWSYISQVKVDGSRQAAVNLLAPNIVEQLESSQLVKPNKP